MRRPGAAEPCFVTIRQLRAYGNNRSRYDGPCEEEDHAASADLFIISGARMAGAGCENYGRGQPSKTAAGSGPDSGHKHPVLFPCALGQSRGL